MQYLTATRSLRYATRDMVAGDDFEATERDARILVLVRRAVVRVAPAPEAEQVPAEDEAAPTTDGEQAADAKPKKAKAK